MNDLETIRRRIGVTRPQFLSLLGAESALVLHARDADSDLVERAAALERDRATFLQGVEKRIEHELLHPDFKEDGVSYLGPRQAARAVGLGDFQFAAARHRGHVRPSRTGINSIGYYTRDDLVSAITRADYTGYQSMLALPFVSWVREQQAV